jgi:hypothetical protein
MIRAWRNFGHKLAQYMLANYVENADRWECGAMEIEVSSQGRKER